MQKSQINMLLIKVRGEERGGAWWSSIINQFWSWSLPEAQVFTCRDLITPVTPLFVIQISFCFTLAIENEEDSEMAKN